MSASSSDKQLKQLRDAIRSGTFARAYHLFGADDFRKDEALRQLLAAAVDSATRDFNLDVRRGADVSAEVLGSLLATPPMMAPRRVVVLREPEGMKKETRSVLDAWCTAPAPDVMLVLVSPASAKADKSLPGALEPVEDVLVRRNSGGAAQREAERIGIADGEVGVQAAENRLGTRAPCDFARSPRERRRRTERTRLGEHVGRGNLGDCRMNGVGDVATREHEYALRRNQWRQSRDRVGDERPIVDERKQLLGALRRRKRPEARPDAAREHNRPHRHPDPTLHVGPRLRLGHGGPGRVGHGARERWAPFAR